ncbi:MAG: hypothetical protein Q7T11_00310 [Deltaproteobacteria bacterium]|nr:hypothetical protein [Deltaproteobacteria bacterium]
MSRALKKDKWTLTFDRDLKSRVQREAKKLHVYPVQILESLVREKMNPYGFQSIQDSIAYVDAIRAKSAGLSNQEFLSEVKKWEKR